MSGAYDVVDLGPDTSGRRVLMNRRMKAAWDRLVAELDFEPTIVQGAYMARQGGGASASAGYHDQGGCVDIRTWDLSAAELDTFIWVAADLVGWIFWRRDALHGGMDPHAHGVLLGDTDAAPGARDQMSQFRLGLDGLAGGPDYERRPASVTPFDYESYLKEYEDMNLDDPIPHTRGKTVGDALRAALQVHTAVGTVRDNIRARDAELAQQLDDLAAQLDQAPEAAEIREIVGQKLRRLKAELVDQP